MARAPAFLERDRRERGRRRRWRLRRPAGDCAELVSGRTPALASAPAPAHAHAAAVPPRPVPAEIYEEFKRMADNNIK
ncbi:Protein of unknown function [Gryllus bimaculatus]|nr:Protein of unknown function [Gryllus bimaculatus]